MTTEPAYSCLNCGAPLSRKFRYSKLIHCNHCQNDLILVDDVLRLRGKSAVLADYPSLLQLGAIFYDGKQGYTPIGRVRYQYSHGYWDEWWVLNDAGDGFWLSVDEGEMALEQPVTLKQTLLFPELKLGDTLEIDKTQWLITEKDQAQCLGLEGELPELITVGEHFSYLHLSAGQNRLMTLEMRQSGLRAYEGQWLDPYDINGAT